MTSPDASAPSPAPRLMDEALQLASLLDQWDGAYTHMERNRQRDEAARLLRALVLALTTPTSSLGEGVAEVERLAAWLDRKATQSPGRIQLDEDEARLCVQALRTLAHPAPAPANNLGEVAISQEIKGVTIKGIPALKDPQTGEVYFSPDTAETLWAVGQVLEQRGVVPADAPAPRPTTGEVMARLREMNSAEDAERMLRDVMAPQLDSQDLVEQLSAAVHADWMEEQRKRGRTSSVGRDGEEYMVPYAQLSDAAKELDRVTVRAVLKHLTVPTPVPTMTVAQRLARGIGIDMDAQQTGRGDGMPTLPAPADGLLREEAARQVELFEAIAKLVATLEAHPGTVEPLYVLTRKRELEGARSKLIDLLSQHPQAQPQAEAEAPARFQSKRFPDEFCRVLYRGPFINGSRHVIYQDERDGTLNEFPEQLFDLDWGLIPASAAAEGEDS